MRMEAYLSITTPPIKLMSTTRFSSPEFSDADFMEIEVLVLKSQDSRMMLRLRAV